MVEKRVMVHCGEPPSVDPEIIALEGGDTFIIAVDRPGVTVFVPLGPVVFAGGKKVYEIAGRELRVTVLPANTIKTDLGRFVDGVGQLPCPCSIYCAESNVIVEPKIRGSAPVIIIKTD